MPPLLSKDFLLLKQTSAPEYNTTSLDPPSENQLLINK